MSIGIFLSKRFILLAIDQNHDVQSTTEVRKPQQRRDGVNKPHPK